MMFEVVLHEEDEVLAGHCVLDKSILPAMGYLDFIIRALRERDGGESSSLYPIKLTELVWLSPLSIPEDFDQRNINVNVSLENNICGARYQVYSQTSSTEPQLHATGVIESLNPLLPTFFKPKKTDTSVDTFSCELVQQDIYQRFQQLGINYQGKFQCLHELKCKETLFLGGIHDPEAMNGNPVSPYILDAAIQTVLLGTREVLGPDSDDVYVPFSLESLVLYAPLNGECKVRVTPKIKVSSQTERFEFDVILHSKSGEILMEMKRLHIRKYKGSNQSESISKSEMNKQNIQQWAVAATFTAEPVAEPLGVWAERLNWACEFNFSPFNQVHQSFLDPNSLLASNTSGVNIVLCRLEDLASLDSLDVPGLPHVTDAQKNANLTQCERFVLPNGAEIAHLKSYETEYLYEEIFLEKTYGKHGISFEPGDVVLDIGGNIGMFSLFATSQSKGLRIFSCEPSPVSYQVLKKNLALYAPESKALQVGIADEDGEAEFVFYPNSSVWSGFHTDNQEDGEALRQSMENEVNKRFEGTDSEAVREHLDTMLEVRLEKQTYKVEMRSLSSIMEEHNIDEIGLLKIDAEKCEWDILRSIGDKEWPKIRQLVVEVHDKEGDVAKSIEQLLKDKGFELNIVEEEMLKSSGLRNFYAKRPTDKKSPVSFEQGIENNFQELLTLMKNTQTGRKVPSLFALCPPSPHAMEKMSVEFTTRMNQLMMSSLANSADIVGIDLERYLPEYNVSEYHDAVRNDMGKIPYLPVFFNALAGILMRYQHAFLRPAYKVIALDCDNTLWSGVVGEQGVDGIDIPPEFQQLQRFMLQQKEQGVLLCLVSKNKDEDIEQVFKQREDMVLKWDDIVATQINWEPKSENLKCLAEQLNLGLDSFIFLDDNPVECAEVSSKYPQVLSLRLPSKRQEILGFLQHVWAFDHVSNTTTEDARRTSMYQEQVQREEFRQGAFNLKDFIDGLALNVSIKNATDQDMERLSQLTKRTNQFNFIKTPLSVDQLIERSHGSNRGCFAVNVTDRFGDYGICGSCLFVEEESQATLLVEGLLLSCRVLGRGIEYAMMNTLGQEALRRGMDWVALRFVESERNKPAQQFLLKIASAYQEDIGNGQWLYKVPANELATLVFSPSDATSNDHTDANVSEEAQPHIVDTNLMQALGDTHGDLLVSASVEKVSGAIVIKENAQPDQENLEAFVQDVVIKKVLESLKKDIEVDEYKAFSDYGIDSFAAINLVVLLNTFFDIKLPGTTLFDYTCVNDLKAYILANHKNDVLNCLNKEPEQTVQRSIIEDSVQSPDVNPQIFDMPVQAVESMSSGIAIIGMSARFPNVANVNEFWQLLEQGKDCISEVPKDRWDIDEYFDEDKAKPNKTYGRRGGFIEDIDKFDAAFFGISGKEARQMDPQQRLFLEECWHALEDAGYANRRIQNKKWGVYAGADAGDYQANLRQHSIPLDASSFMGNDSSILAARIAYFMDMKGPAMALDTASSSSLTAVHFACESLKSGKISMAIAGGVSVHTTANFHILCAKAGMLSSDGHCKPFDHKADGFVPGEAVGVVVLKRLDDAIRDKDTIYSVIKGSLMNQDGKTNGITAPSSLSQTDLVSSLYQELNLNVEDINYVEAHGTGTKLGDPIEITALTEAFRQQTEKRAYCSIGSVKSNIGHCVHASGISALVKLQLSFKHRKLAPSINFEKPNPLIPFEETPFVVNTQLQDWQPNSKGQRVAAVSSFGFSGTNVHMVLEEYLSHSNDTPCQSGSEPGLFLISARSQSQLKTLANALKTYLKDSESIDGDMLKDIAFTLQMGREPLGYRLAIAAKHTAELVSGLDDFIAENSFSNRYFSGVVTQGERNKENTSRQKMLIQTELDSKNLLALANFWVSGLYIDWQALYASNRQRVSGLPLYPFDRERYWLPEDINSPTTPSISPEQPHISALNSTPKVKEILTTDTTIKENGKRALVSLDNFSTYQAGRCETTSLSQGVYRLQCTGSIQAADMRAKLAAISTYADAKVIILACDGGNFLSFAEEDAELAQQLNTQILDMPLPVIASLSGDAKGYAWLVACVCEFMLISDSGQYHFSNQQQNVAKQSRRLLTERFGVTQAEALLTGKATIAADLKALGLALPTFPFDDVNEQSVVLARELACVPKAALVHLKQHFAVRLKRYVQADNLSHFEKPILQAHEQVLFDKNWLQAFEAGYLNGPSSVAKEITLRSNAIQASAYSNGVLVIRLCERDSRNKFSKAFVSGVEEVFAHIAENSHYKIAILTGYDQYFASGGTLETLMAIHQGKAKFTDEKIFALPLECEIPVIAAMQGHGIGPGLALGMFCDDAIFSKESVYFSPYMQYGFTPGAGSTLSLPQSLGLDLAREALFTAREYKGSELEARGLCKLVLERARVLPFALAVANKLALSTRAELVAQKNQRAAYMRSQVEANYALELEMHTHTFVGKRDVAERIQRHFNQGMQDTQIANIQEVNTQQANTQETNTQETNSNVQTESAEKGFAQVSAWLCETLAQELAIHPETIEDTLAFVDLGLDSITGVTWVRKINAHFALDFNAAEVYSHPNLEAFTRLVIEHVGSSSLNESELVVPLPKKTNNVVNTGKSDTQIIDFLSETLAQELQIKREDLDPNLPFIDLGLDSITGVTWVRKINAHFELNINTAEIYSHPTLQRFARLIPVNEVSRGAEQPVFVEPVSPPIARPSVTPIATTPVIQAATTNSETPNVDGRIKPLTTPFSNPRDAVNTRQRIAVIGMSGQFPGAKNLEQYWDNLINGNDSILEIPPERWDQDRYFSTDRKLPGKSYSRWMGVMEDADKFDPLFFNISPREAELMDPQQRVFLETCWASIENAGYNPESLSGTNCGVFAGCGAGDYASNFHLQDVNAQTFTGNEVSILAARISYHLNLQGPSMAIDTACSSSLVAIATACDNLTLGNTDLALAGGVTILAGPRMHIMTSKAGMLSENGRCFTFDQKANGFVPGEAVGVVILKRLEDAVRDKDIIQGVINAWGVNQDGKSNGITAPNGESQSRLEQEVYRKFGVDPEQIQFVETHGTGTKLGDPVEVQGLKQTFAQFTQKQNYCALGSVKSNIGHTLRAAGVASVIKVLLAMKHRQIPPTLHHKEINEHIALEGTPFFVNSEPKTWTCDHGHQRQAAVSSFGFSGTNVHLVLEEYAADAPVLEATDSESPVLIVLSAKTQDSLMRMASNLLEHVDQYLTNEESDSRCRHYLESIAFTLQTGRAAMKERVGLAVNSLEELQSKLKALIAGVELIQACYKGQGQAHQDILSMFDVDEDVHQLIQAWANKGKVARLLALWVKGIDINWDILYSQTDNKPCVVSLPSYPFAREKYWVRETSNSLEQERMTKKTAVSREREAHGVLQQTSVNNADTGNVLPGLELLEMTRIASERSTGQQVVEFINVIWGHPASTDDAAQGFIQTYLSEEEDGVYFQCVTEKDNVSTTHNFGQIVLRSGVIPQPREDLAALESVLSAHSVAPNPQCNLPDCVEKLVCDGESLLATLRWSSDRDSKRQAATFQPEFLSVSWQLLKLLHLSSGPSTEEHPFSLDAIMAYQPMKDRVTVHITPYQEAHEFSPDTDDMPAYDIRFYNDSGALCLHLKNLKCTSLDGLVALEYSID